MEEQTQTSQPYPVGFSVRVPDRFERVQVVLRIGVAIALGVVHQSAGGAFGALYLLLPIIAALLISQRSGAGFLAQDGPWLIVALEWVIGVYAYLMFVTDRFPLGTRERSARLQVRLAGSPSVGSALVRLIGSLPHIVLLALLGIVSGFVSLIAAIAILFSERYPRMLYEFQRGIVAYLGRIFAYHASLIDTYPPFSLANHGSDVPPASDAGRLGATS